MNTRRAGIGRNVCARSSASNSSSSRDTPYSSTSARVIWSMPGAPSLRRTWLHARCRTSLRWTLSYSAWNRRPGSALAARYSACCRARTASSRRSTPGAGLAHTALTGHSLSTCAWTKQRPFPSPAVVLSIQLDRYYGRLRRRPGRSPTSRLDTGYRTPRSGESPQSPGRGRPPLFPPSPSQRSAPSTPRSSSRLNSRLCTASMAFTLKDGAQLSFDPAPSRALSRRGRLRLMLRTAQLLPLTRAFDTALRRRAFPPDAGSLLPGPLAATRTGLAPAGNDELPTESDHVITQPLSNCRAYSRVS